MAALWPAYSTCQRFCTAVTDANAREMLLNAATSLELFNSDFHFHFFRKSFNIEAGCIRGDLRLRLKV